MPETPPTQLTPFFLDSPRGPLFCIYHAPADTPPLQAMLYLHPFAEEMHKSRRMAALQSRALAAQGIAVLQLDLTGSGDSHSDFGDANWTAWQEDVATAHAWLTNKAPVPFSLWGLRTGALLAADCARRLPEVHSVLLWQPVTSGDLFLNQFLRIKLASEMLAEGQSQTGTKTLRAQLEAGQGIEIGGNMLSPAMAQELASLKLADLPPPCPTHWLEVGAETSNTLPPASQRVADTWRASGCPIQTQVIPGDPFWLTQEITECPDLIKATLNAMNP